LDDGALAADDCGVGVGVALADVWTLTAAAAVGLLPVVTDAFTAAVTVGLGAGRRWGVTVGVAGFAMDVTVVSAGLTAGDGVEVTPETALVAAVLTVVTTPELTVVTTPELTVVTTPERSPA
jgi:hypothetical protein